MSRFDCCGAFLVVAEEQNIGRAARRLYISQPALSQDVRDG